MTSLIRALSLFVANAVSLYSGTAAKVTADQIGSAVEVSHFEGDILFEGNLSHTNDTGTAILKVQHSHTTTSGDFVDLAGVTCSSSQNAPGRFRMVKNKDAVRRYVRAIVDITGSVSVVADCSAMGLYKDPT